MSNQKKRKDIDEQSVITDYFNKRVHTSDEETSSTTTTTITTTTVTTIKKQRLEYRRCTKCRITKPIDMFFTRKNTKNKGLKIFLCKSCDHISYARYRRTLKGALKSMFHTCTHTAKKRLKRGRKEAGICSLTYEELLEQYRAQRGYCYYFPTKKMSFAPHSTHSISLERLNPELGYSKENIVLCCCEFNVSRTWTVEKIRLLKLIHSKKIVEPLFDTDGFLSEATTPNPSLYGSTCQDTSHVKNAGRCTKCRKDLNKRRRRTAYGFIQGLYTNLLASSEDRSKRKHRTNEDHIVTLTKEDIVRKMIEQEGRCAISDKVMAFQSNYDWQFSIERKDNTKGYSIDNTCLICVEFQCKRNWTKEMFKEWMNSLVDISE
jgi:hypothetical protein